jgi:hypothetical protein
MAGTKVGRRIDWRGLEGGGRCEARRALPRAHNHHAHSLTLFPFFSPFFFFCHTHTHTHSPGRATFFGAPDGFTKAFDNRGDGSFGDFMFGSCGYFNKVRVPLC